MGVMGNEERNEELACSMGRTVSARFRQGDQAKGTRGRNGKWGEAGDREVGVRPVIVRW